jgi:hypothetical protein
MLVRGCVKHVLGPETLAESLKSRTVTNVGDLRADVQGRELLSQVPVQEVQLVLVDVRQHQAFGPVSGQLPADLAAD